MLVVGAEQMTTTPAAEIGRNLLKPRMCVRRPISTAASPAFSARSPSLYFQRWGDQSDALARIAAKNHKNGVGNPYAQIRKDLGYDFCRTESDKNPSSPGRSSAPTVRWCPTALPHWCWPMSRPR